MIGPAGFGAAPKATPAQVEVLGAVLPREFFAEFMDTPAARLLDVEVAATLRMGEPGSRWPGKHKNVYVWWKLADGRCVGWNENPSRGWSFPVARWQTR